MTAAKSSNKKPVDATHLDAADDHLEEAKAVAGTLQDQALMHASDTDDPVLDSVSVAHVVHVIVEKICAAQRALSKVHGGES